MNDFWEWMEMKEYGRKDNPKGKTWIYTSGYAVKPTNRMLIGYMMEYLDREDKISLNIGGRATIKDVYDRYVKDIEKIEQEAK